VSDLKVAGWIRSKYRNSDSEKKRAVLAAAEVGNKEALEEMMNSPHAFSLKVKDKDGKTPAHLAAKYGKLDVLQFIAQNAPDSLTEKIKHGKTPRDLLPRSTTR
jgi:ankyrin repeat protein